MAENKRPSNRSALPEHPRYRIVDVIARGDFATVYRGVDRELNREIAIKQIHEQFLEDPHKLDRYWHEAQLLARLEHPYIMTIYDIVRERGWLILELMKGSLKQKLDGKPIDIEDLRLTIIYICQALKFLRDNGIVHGDVKPTNLLIDKNNRVKLGDFGIARRMSGDEGSVVKGTTKYMAPEVLSDQFGDVGHHSDIYSLGFSSYELLCGSHFEALFPGLNMFGRDPQVAWMMWHSAMDRRLPEIKRVLDGVPADLAGVIEKMCQKDPTKRYRSAEEVLRELKLLHEGKDPAAEEAKKKAEEEQKRLEAKKRRRMALIAVGVSLSATVGMLFLPSGEKKKELGPVIPAEAIVRHVDAERNELIVQALDEKGEPVSVIIRPGVDVLSLNSVTSQVAELREGDRVQIKGDEKLRVVQATRELNQSVAGRIESVDPVNSIIKLESSGGPTQPVSIYVPSTLALQINGRDKFRGKGISLSSIQVGDEAKIECFKENEQFVAAKLSVLRQVSTAGKVLSVDKDKREISLQSADELGEFKVAMRSDAAYELNEVSKKADGQIVTLTDIKAGDEVKITHDEIGLELSAVRELRSLGTIKQVNLGERSIAVELDEPKLTPLFTCEETTKILESSKNGTRDFAYLLPGDRVEVVHRSLDFVNATAEQLLLTPAKKKDRWGLVITVGDFADDSISDLPEAEKDGQFIADTLVGYYRVPAEQVIQVNGPTKEVLTAELDKLVGKTDGNSQLVVLFVGHGFVDRNRPVLALSDTVLAKARESGFEFADFLAKLEAIPSRETLLFLDTCQTQRGKDVQKEPDSATFAGMLRKSDKHPVSTKVSVISSCEQNQRGQRLTASGQGLFVTAISNALQGPADGNRDSTVNFDEFSSYLPSESKRLADGGKLAPQSPAFFAANARPPRLLDQTKQNVKGILANLALNKLEDFVAEQYQFGTTVQSDQPDLDIAYAIVNLKFNRPTEARRVFEMTRARHPNAILAHMGLAWQEIVAKKHKEGVENLVLAMKQFDEPENEDDKRFQVRFAQFAGELREFVCTCPMSPLTDGDVVELDNTVGEMSQEIGASYQAGRDKVKQALTDVDAKIAASKGNEEELEKLQRDRARPSFYTYIDFDLMSEYLQSHLDD